MSALYFFFSCKILFFFSSRNRHTRYWRDWISDVCSSDLSDGHTPQERAAARAKRVLSDVIPELGGRSEVGHAPKNLKIGRASCRERGKISVVAGSLKKKNAGK